MARVKRGVRTNARHQKVIKASKGYYVARKILFTISLINSINYTVLTLFFSYNVILINYLINNFFTFLLYLVFVYLFKQYLRGLND